MISRAKLPCELASSNDRRAAFAALSRTFAALIDCQTPTTGKIVAANITRLHTI